MAESKLPEDHWNEFKTKYPKSYKNEEEEQMRFKIFKDNLKNVEEHNKKIRFGHDARGNESNERL
ncbi:hypothetical protein NQ317_003053 [Molorchus minor]|uniref:Cathepsin propeptide inhibitor domain-containing protein n=1 Tax=Molorchus minor TaxID=1323400 RepID=A0ABQ9JK12_9CUCU|nr:hypothetical protein NQ317_003053 [Molorchus minor]